MFDIYTKPSCSRCVAAKQFFTQKNITFNEIRVGVDLPLEEVIALFPEMRTVPIIVEDGRLIGGYSDLQEEFMTRNVYLKG